MRPLTVKLLGPKPKDWYNYQVKGVKDHGYAIVHRDTGAVISAQTYRSRDNELHDYLAYELLASFIKTKADLYRFFAFISHIEKNRWTRSDGYNPRTTSVRVQVEAERGRATRTLKDCLQLLVNCSNTCCGIFETFGYHFTPEIEKLYGRDGLKNLKKFEPVGYPFVPKQVSPQLAKEVIAYRESLWSTKPTQVTYDPRVKGYRSPHTPYCVYRVSYHYNGGEFTQYNDETLYVHRRYERPPPYLKRGELCDIHGHTYIVREVGKDGYIVAISVETFQTAYEPMWDRDHGEYEPRLHKVA